MFRVTRLIRFFSGFPETIQLFFVILRIEKNEKMKKIKLFSNVLMIVALCSFASCDKDNEVKDKVEEITVCVSAETGIYNGWTVHGVEGMMIRAADENEFHCVPFNEITGFTYERGYAYELLVKRTRLANPPQDSGFYRDELIRIISKNKAADSDLETPTSTTDLTLANAPIIDGSDSTEPLRSLLMCRLLGIECQWLQNLHTNATWSVIPVWSTLSQEDKHALQQILQNRNTHGSFVGLIDGENDIIVTARGISRDEKKYAEEKGVSLLSRPVAKDAFVFLVNPKNPVQNLTIEQIQRIYTGEIRNWKEVGGNDATINPYIRNANSGSQEKMETIVMQGLPMIDWPEMVGYVMLSPYYQLEQDENGIAYTPFYYYDTIVNDDRTRVIGVNGIMPSKSTIEDGSYPYVTEVMTSVRTNVDKSSTTYQLFYQLSTGEHNDIIKESGYIVYK